MRFLILMAIVLGLAPAAFAAADLEQQSAWMLKTATTAPITKDHFCANTAVFAKGTQLAVARNVIGQISLVLTVPDAHLAPGSTVPVRLALDGKPMRDAQAQARSATILVIPFGWDEDLVGALSVAKHIGLVTDSMNLRLGIYDNSAVMSRLASCAASLLERAPDTSSLSSDVSRPLHRAGLDQAAHALQPAAAPGSAAHYVVNGIYGGSDSITADNVQAAMLDYIDRLELVCKSKFDSTLGAPTAGPHPVVVADASCKNGQTGSQTSLVFSGGDDIRVYYFESAVERSQQVMQLRDRLAAVLP